MTSIRKLIAGLMVLAALVFAIGCGDTKEKPKDGQVKKKDKDKAPADHDHEAPHDGAIAEWGNEDYHAEFTVDHKTKTATVYILGKDCKTPAPIKADKVLLSITKPAPFTQLDLKPKKQEKDPEGSASVFVGMHDTLGKEVEFEGELSAEFNGEKYTGKFKEKDDHHKKK